MRHFQRLGVWKPSASADFRWRPISTGEEFCTWLGLQSDNIDVRGPDFHLWMAQHLGVCDQKNQGKFDHPLEYPTTYWHRDGVEDDDGSYNDEYDELVMWSNRRPTEVCLPNGRIVQGQSCEAIVFRNTTCLHRTPLLRVRDQRSRNFIRLCVPRGLTFLD